MVCLSTVWFGARLRSAGEQVRSSAALGFEGLELSRESPIRDFEDLAPALRETGVRLSAIQAGCRDGEGAEADLSSTNDDRRSAAVEDLLGHVSLAVSAGCSLVTIPGGVVGGPHLQDRARRLHGLLERRQPPETLKEVKEEILLEAARDRERHLDRLCRSLHAIFARAPSIRLALETPADPHGVLTPEAGRMVLDDLRGRLLGYAHDTGRAEILASLGGPPAADWGERLADRMAAVRLHDVVEFQGGYPPGTGRVDFSLVASYTPRQALRILVTDARFGREDLLEGRLFLRKHRL